MRLRGGAAPDFGRRKFDAGRRGKHGQVAAGRDGNRSQRVVHEVGKLVAEFGVSSNRSGAVNANHAIARVGLKRRRGKLPGELLHDADQAAGQYVDL